MPRTLDYSSPAFPDPVDDVALQRYFVYGMEKRTMRKVRFETQAHGLAGLGHLLRTSGYWPQLVVVAPERALAEPPDLQVYLDEASNSGDTAAQAQIEVMSQNSFGSTTYELISTLYGCEPIGRAELSRDLLLSTSEVFRLAGISAIPHGEAAEQLALRGLVYGITYAGLGLLTFYVLNITKQSLVSLEGGLAFVFLLVPGIVLLVIGFEDMKNRRWVPIVATVIGSVMVLFTVLCSLTYVAHDGSMHPVIVVLGLSMISISGRYLALAIQALRERRSR